MNVDTLIDKNIIDDDVVEGVGHFVMNIFGVDSLLSVTPGDVWGWVHVKERTPRYSRALRTHELWKDVK